MKLRFTIRDLLWLVVVLPLAFGWWRNNVRLNGEIVSLYERWPTRLPQRTCLDDPNVPAEASQPRSHVPN